MRYRVTPSLVRGAFFSEKAAKDFLEKRIASDGGCRVRFNPNNPLETVLYGEGVIDKLGLFGFERVAYER
jgi:hypothetical protein